MRGGVVSTTFPALPNNPDWYLFLPLISRGTSPLPELVNGFFDQGPEIGWTRLRNGESGVITYPQRKLPSEISVPSPEYLAWLGGRLKVTDQLTQSIVYPGYKFRITFKYFTTSRELKSDCNEDQAGMIIAGTFIQIPQFKLCDGPGNETNAWVDGTVEIDRPDLAGQRASFGFQVVADGDRNSNLWLDNLQIVCGFAEELPPEKRCS
jgi:hypothetical protein